MMRPAVLILALLALPAPAQQPADAVSSGTISLAQVRDRVRSDNPELLAYRKRWDAARRRVVPAATPEKPRLDMERMYAPAGANVVTDPDEKSFSVTQEVPFPTTLYFRRGVAAREAAIQEQAYRAKLLEVSARARSVYALFFLAEKSLGIYDENIEIMRRFSKVAESKVASGRGSQSDALKAQVELTRMLNLRTALEAERETSRAMLNALMGREAGALLGAPREPLAAELSGQPAEMEAAALSGRPELRGADLAVRRAEESLALARSEYLPDLMLQYRRRSDPMRGRTHDAVLGLSLPLWFWKPAARAREAEAERDTAQAELRAERLSTQAQARAGWSKVQAARRLLEAYRTTLLFQAEESLRVAESGYRSDKTGFLDLLDAERSRLGFKLEYYQYMAELEQRMAELERIVGREL